MDENYGNRLAMMMNNKLTRNELIRLWSRFFYSPVRVFYQPSLDPYGGVPNLKTPMTFSGMISNELYVADVCRTRSQGNRTELPLCVK
jgi:hypothetical protein